MSSRSPNDEPVRAAGIGALLAGGLAAILASSCCLGPLVLVMVGLSGAWIGNLAALGPFRPVFIGIAVLALAFAWRPVWKPGAACAPGDACAVPRFRLAGRILFVVVAVLVLVALGFPYAAPWFY
jgi:mercuric ion transport protein